MMRPLVLLVLPLALLIASCSDIHVFEGGSRNPHPVKTVVSLSPSTSELAGAYYRATLEGRTASCDYPPSVKVAPVVMNGVKPDYEKIIYIKPDAVFYDKSLFKPEDLSKIESAGIKTYGFGGNSLAEFRKSLWQGASITNNEVLVNDYDDNIYKNLSNAQSSLNGKHLKVAIVDPGAGGEFLVAGTGGFLADIVKQMGQTPIGPNGPLFAKMNPEQLIAQNPDVLIVVGNKGAPDKVYADPRMQATNAWKKRNFFGIPADVAEREGARVDQLVITLGEELTLAKS